MPTYSLPYCPADLTIYLQPVWNAPLPLNLTIKPVSSVYCLAPLHLQRELVRPVSYYAFFKGWLLLSQPPGC